MPFIIVAVLSGAIGLLRGGRIYNLTHLSIRWSGLPLLALGLQLFIIYGPARADARSFGLPALMILGSYVLLVFAVLANRRIPGMMLLGVGAALNLLVILLNGGWMPVTAEHLVAAGLLSSPTALEPGQRVPFSKDVLVARHEGYLSWLSDVFMISKAGPLSAVFSLGDGLMMLGLFWIIQYGIMRGGGDDLQAARS
jgi:hypothetical protein